MLYPAILLVLAIAVLIFLMTFFIPRFQKMFEGFGGQLPLLTRIIVGVSYWIRHYGLFIAVGIVSGGVHGAQLDRPPSTAGASGKDSLFGCRCWGRC